MKKNKVIAIPLRKPITKCKKCGKMGHLVRYTDGTAIMEHKVVIRKIFGMIAPEITESCWFNKEDL